MLIIVIFVKQYYEKDHVLQFSLKNSQHGQNYAEEYNLLHVVHFFNKLGVCTSTQSISISTQHTAEFLHITPVQFVKYFNSAKSLLAYNYSNK